MLSLYSAKELIVHVYICNVVVELAGKKTAERTIEKRGWKYPRHDDFQHKCNTESCAQLKHDRKPPSPFS